MGACWLVLAAVPGRPEAVITVAGAASALGGLALVFLGVIIGGYKAYDSETAAAVLRPYQWATGGILFAFALSLACAALSVAWLATAGGAGALYESALWTFFALLVAVFLAALATTYLIVLT